MRRSSGFGLDAGNDDAGSSAAAAALLTNADSEGAALLDATLLSDSRSGRQHRLLGGVLCVVVVLNGGSGRGGQRTLGGRVRSSGARAREGSCFFGSRIFPASYCKLLTGLQLAESRFRKQKSLVPIERFGESSARSRSSRLRRAQISL